MTSQWENGACDVGHFTRKSQSDKSYLCGSMRQHQFHLMGIDFADRINSNETRRSAKSTWPVCLWFVPARATLLQRVPRDRASFVETRIQIMFSSPHWLTTSVKRIEAKTDWEKTDQWPLDVTECTRSVDPIRWHLKVPSIAEKIHIISSDTRHWFKRYVDLFLCMRFFMMNGLCARRDMTLYAFRCPRFHRIARLITRIIVKVLLTLTQIELNIGNVNIESSDQSIQNPIHHKIPGIDWKRGNDFRTNPSHRLAEGHFDSSLTNMAD